MRDGEAGPGAGHEVPGPAGFSPLGVRVFPIEEARRIGVVGAGLWLAAGLSVLQTAVFARDVVRHPGAFTVWSIGVTALGVVLVGLVRVVDDAMYQRLYRWLVPTALVAAVAARERTSSQRRPIDRQRRPGADGGRPGRRTGHLARLRRFLSPQVADAVVSSGDDSFLAPHRREIAVLFCDLRGFTAFAAQVEPEEVMDVIGEYIEVVGEQITAFDATVGSFAGDGVMAYFNDPKPCERPATQAARMGVALLAALDRLAVRWADRGYQLGGGIGIATGHATLGMVGFEGRHDYTPLGTVVNRAARLCDEAAAGEILVDRRTVTLLDDEPAVGDERQLALKGFAAPVPAYPVVRR